ncbi:MAG TPA: dTDP-4-dehydrorhamnose reductase [Polyangiaceae bacterium]|nr:dTDP-4-dehydrorhamnose reductase [Polyangiaceae bacterium]
MKVWLVGGKGMLGTALRERLERFGVTHVITDLALDITDPERVAAYAHAERPTHVLNAAGYTRVDDAEAHEDEAFRVNALGPEHLARAATDVGARFLHISTDYVFPGDASEPYVENAPTGPKSAYGRTKLAGEERVLALPGAEKLVTVVRTSWLFGENGPSFPKTISRLCLERDKLEVVVDQLGRPTYTGDLADAVLELEGIAPGRSASPAGVYHFANAGTVSWHAFAEAIRETLVRLRRRVTVERVLPTTSEEYKRKNPNSAPRPRYSVLDTSRIEAALGRAPRPFRQPLDEFLARLAT